MIVGLPWCAHGRTGDTCPDCRLIEAAERGLPIGTPVVAEPAPEPVLAEQDMMIERADVSVPGAYVLIKAGDPIPLHLVEALRVPVRAPVQEAPVSEEAPRRGRTAM